MGGIIIVMYSNYRKRELNFIFCLLSLGKIGSCSGYLFLLSL